MALCVALLVLVAPRLLSWICHRVWGPTRLNVCVVGPENTGKTTLGQMLQTGRYWPRYPEWYHVQHGHYLFRTVGEEGGPWRKCWLQLYAWHMSRPWNEGQRHWQSRSAVAGGSSSWHVHFSEFLAGDRWLRRHGETARLHTGTLLATTAAVVFMVDSQD
eukprot:COSAG01_NODE_32248_length_584_cov_0.938144_1_plen_159_part_01